MTGVVTSVHISPTHTFSKRSVDAIKLIEGQGVEGDAHCGVTVKHRSRVAAHVELPPLPHFPLTRV